jgi:hypothetical protein
MQAALGDAGAIVEREIRRHNAIKISRCVRNDTMPNTFANLGVQMKLTVLTAAAILFTIGHVASANPPSPYAGQEIRDIKALSPQEVQDYLAGKGMGLAKAAELNRYPGPAHVLELAAPLKLTPEQKTRTQELFNRMQEKAKGLGRLLVEEEQKLDKLFSRKAVTPTTLKNSLERLGKLQADLRFTHLEAHLAQAEILSAPQIDTYVTLRGYDSATGASHEHTHQH